MSKQCELPEIMQVIADFMIDALISRGISEFMAAELSVDCAIALMKAVGGDNVYIPKGVQMEYNKRDLKIYKEFEYMDIREICKIYGVTPRRIRQIIAAVKLGIEVPEQFMMFDSEGNSNVGSS